MTGQDFPVKSGVGARRRFPCTNHADGGDCGQARHNGARWPGGWPVVLLTIW